MAQARNAADAVRRMIESAFNSLANISNGRLYELWGATSLHGKK
jgi:hypothetical protein